MRKYTLLLLLSFFSFSASRGQSAYQYSVDLTSINNDKLSVTLVTPKLARGSGVFAFPKIIPGTYSISDYGEFVSDLKAYNSKGKSLKVKRLNQNQWQISQPKKLHKITYIVEDIFDSDKKHKVYPMAATNFEDKNIVLHTPGIFGFLEGAPRLPFELNIRKPASFYGSTSLKPVSTTAQEDRFKVADLDELYDFPLMYGIPDTASVKVGNCEVLVSVYSPNGMLNAKDISQWLSRLLYGAKNYLGGKLPADRYAFLYYFKGAGTKHSFPPGLGGALEHTTSSFYYLPEGPADRMKNNIVDVSSHEFFHIITPLTIASREVKQFNFDEAVLSKHLWLYEGTTEYTAHHVQVRSGLNTPEEFLKKLSEMITTSQKLYQDTLPFTRLSKEAAGTYAEQYGNVYQKGALIAACLDLYLLQLSDGHYGLRNLTHDLGVRYGRQRYFKDEELFDVIAELTYPEIKDFLVKYVAGPNAIPYNEFFRLAGVDFLPKTERKVNSLGGFFPGLNDNGKIYITEQSRLNDFGVKLGFKPGDEIWELNGSKLTVENIGEVLTRLKKNLKPGDQVTAVVGRKNSQGTAEPVKLATPFFQVTEVEQNKLALNPHPTEQQLLVRRAWLGK